MNGAFISECTRYRYWLTRDVLLTSGLGRPRRITWVMLNPSTADARDNDPTIGRVVDFSFQWGFDALCVVNLFAYRATDPKNLPMIAALDYDILGPSNNAIVTTAVQSAELVVCAWGSEKFAQSEGQKTQKAIRMLGKIPFCLGTNKNGSPKHPLYLKKNTQLVEYK